MLDRCFAPASGASISLNGPIFALNGNHLSIVLLPLFHSNLAISRDTYPKLPDVTRPPMRSLPL